ncbi:restriction alleviation protein, Lar family [Yokenella regensburgei]|nr:restriction alleviation protein, Lar family [Yokenella regensburgei]
MSYLEPCPFCGAGTASLDETKHWTGQRYIILKAYLRHWCEDGQTEIKVTRKTHQECIDAWNEMMSNANRDDQDRRGSIRSGV